MLRRGFRQRRADVQYPLPPTCRIMVGPGIYADGTKAEPGTFTGPDPVPYG